MITYNQIKQPEYKKWLTEYKAYLVENWGLNSDLAEKVAVFLLYAYFYGLNWTINSGFRDPEYQKELQKRWDAGNRTGIVARPATNSLHSVTGWLSKPDSHAIDLKFNDQNLAGQLSPFFGLKWGGNFNSRDPVHFYV